MTRSKVIAITGSIGTGKSTVAWMFEEMGVPVIDVDELAHEALSPHSHIWELIFKRFGKAVMLEEGTVDRKALGKIVFDDEDERKFLEQIIHPHVRYEVGEKIAKLSKDGHPYIVVDIPLLFEAGWQEDFDAIIVVRCTIEEEIKRCEEKFELTRDETIARISAQLPIEQKIKLADAVIDNDRNLEETKVQVHRIFHRMESGKFPKQ